MRACPPLDSAFKQDKDLGNLNDHAFFRSQQIELNLSSCTQLFTGYRLIPMIPNVVG